MTVYIHQTENSDLSPSWPNTTAFDKEMRVGAGTDTTLVVSLSASETQSGGYITTVGVPNSDAWADSGSWTLNMEVDTGNHQITARCRAVRLAPDGTILQSGSFTATQALSANVAFTITAPAWTDSEEDCNNRIAIEIEFIENQGMANSVTLGIGTGASNTTTDVVDDEASCISAALVETDQSKHVRSPDLEVVASGMTVGTENE